MKRCLLFCGIEITGLPSAYAASSACTSPDGSRFNLEPRANAVVQAAQSVAFLLNGVSAGIDLVVATAADMRGIAGSTDAFYVQRSNASCKADLEGGLPFITNIFGTFGAFGTPIVVADPPRSAFFIADLRFSGNDNNGVGILRATAAGLLNKNACPDGTQVNGSASCFTTGSVFNITTLNAFLFNPDIAVDSRTSGTGAGDVYAVVAQADPNNTLHTSISMMACTNLDLNCSNSIKISGNDLEANFASVRVRPDGSVTVAYRNTTFPGVNPETIKFVICTPKGAPNPPTCSAPIVVSTEKTPIFASFIGDVPMNDALYPRHAHRLESNKSVTTFLVYDRCAVPVVNYGFVSEFCPKTEVVITSSKDGGKTWSPISTVSNAVGQQFFGAIDTDNSTQTVNIAFYSTENDPFQQRPQIFLAQIAPGSTSVGTPHLLTSGTADVQAISPLIVQFEPTGFGDRIGLAAAGTGSPGQSHAYVGFTWNSVFGTYSGIPSADMNNHLTRFQY